MSVSTLNVLVTEREIAGVGLDGRAKSGRRALTNYG